MNELRELFVEMMMKKVEDMVANDAEVVKSSAKMLADLKKEITNPSKIKADLKKTLLNRIVEVIGDELFLESAVKMQRDTYQEILNNIIFEIVKTKEGQKYIKKAIIPYFEELGTTCVFESMMDDFEKSHRILMIPKDIKEQKKTKRKK